MSYDLECKIQESIDLAVKNMHTYAIVASLSISSTLNPDFICSGYCESEALENAYNELNLFDKNYSFEEYLQDITILNIERL